MRSTAGRSPSDLGASAEEEESGEEGSRGVMGGGRGMEWAARAVVRTKGDVGAGDGDGRMVADWRLATGARRAVRGRTWRRAEERREVVLDAMLLVVGRDRKKRRWKKLEAESWKLPKLKATDRLDPGATAKIKIWGRTSLRGPCRGAWLTEKLEDYLRQISAEIVAH